MEFSGAKRDDFKVQSRLEPVNESGGSALLNMVRPGPLGIQGRRSSSQLQGRQGPRSSRGVIPFPGLTVPLGDLGPVPVLLALQGDPAPRVAKPTPAPEVLQPLQALGAFRPAQLQGHHRGPCYSQLTNASPVPRSSAHSLSPSLLNVVCGVISTQGQARRLKCVERQRHTASSLWTCCREASVNFRTFLCRKFSDSKRRTTSCAIGSSLWNPQ